MKLVRCTYMTLMAQSVQLALKESSFGKGLVRYPIR